MATFSKRHYESIALYLRESNAPINVVEKFAREFRADNPKFNPHVFLSAAGFTKVEPATHQVRERMLFARLRWDGQWHPATYRSDGPVSGFYNVTMDYNGEERLIRGDDLLVYTREEA